MGRLSRRLGSRLPGQGVQLCPWAPSPAVKTQMLQSVLADEKLQVQMFNILGLSSGHVAQARKQGHEADL